MDVLNQSHSEKEKVSGNRFLNSREEESSRSDKGLNFHYAPEMKTDEIMSEWH